MRAAEPLSPADSAIQAIRDGLDIHFAEADRQRLRELRRRIAKRIEADIAALDMLGGDPDLEPSLGAVEPCTISWMLTGRDGVPYHPGDQARWADGATDDREQEDEHGGAIDDEPHDPEEDDDRDSGCADEGGRAEQFGFSRLCMGGAA